MSGGNIIGRKEEGVKDDWIGNRKFGEILVLAVFVSGLFLIGVGVLASYYAYFTNRFSLQIPNFIKKAILLTLSAFYEYSHFTWDELLMRKNLCTIRIIQSFALGALFLWGAYYIHHVLKQQQSYSSPPDRKVTV